jgi:hypothetical protein
VRSLVAPSAVDMLAAIHRIARQHDLAVDIVDMGPPPDGGAPYRWRLAVYRNGDPHDIVVGAAAETADDLVEAVDYAWDAFERWGIA